LAYEVAWYGSNYCRNDSQGTEGVIAFAEPRLVGVFFDVHSLRSPFRSGRVFDERPFFAGAPHDLLALAHEQAMSFILQEYQGASVPLITAAFWSEGERLTAAEPWPAVVEHGAHLVAIEVMETDQAMAELENNYALSPGQMTLVRALYSRKRAAPDMPVVLTERERGILLSAGAAGLDESRVLLQAIGIAIP
jgi:hypothetical protein